MSVVRIVYERPNYRRLSRDPQFIARVMEKWDTKKDTAQIAVELMTPEAAIASALAFGREQRRLCG